MTTKNASRIFCTALTLAAITFSLAARAQAQTETVLFNVPGGPLGSLSEGGLVFDQAGNLYGTATAGGDTTNCTSGCGVVFELSPTASGWQQSVIYTLPGRSYGANPIATMIFDKAGNLYGTAMEGGNTKTCSKYGCGVVFELSPTTSGEWKETVLHAFAGPSAADGDMPSTNLTFDAAGNLYGTTYYGGTSTACPQGCGTVYKLSRDAGGLWKESVLHAFDGLGDGSIPNTGVTLDAAGNLYGTTAYRGAGANGVVYRLSNTSGSWRESVLYTFQGHADGGRPSGLLTFDAAGNLYGTAETGGSNFGTVFELSPTSTLPWKETVLHTFSSSNDGQYPVTGVVFDAAGNLWGTTVLGGASNDGTVFELSPTSSGTWTESFVSFNFTDGSEPVSNVIFDAAGHLYGTTQFGGTGSNGGDGVVFEITP